MSIKLKICGVRSANEARQLAGLPIDYVGLNFIPVSTRLIDLQTAESIMAEFNGTSIKIVALFADQPPALVNDYAGRLRVDYVQLHGDETADYASQIKTPVMKAVAVDPAEQAGNLCDYISKYPADYFVLDRMRQGSGEMVEPGLVATIAELYHDKIFLAGGLSPDNLETVLPKVRPYGIDIAGGVRLQNELDINKVKRCLELLAD